MSGAAHSQTAQHGIRLLQGGTTVLKYGREGKPHATQFRLSEDRAKLIWRGKRSSIVGKLASKEEKSVELHRVNHFLVGRESAVFKRFNDERQRSSSLESGNWADEVHEDSVDEQRVARRAPGREHLSLSLQFGWAAASVGKQRDTLDLSFEDEESFGLWVAALRVLIPAHALGPDLRGVRGEGAYPVASAAPIGAQASPLPSGAGTAPVPHLSAPVGDGSGSGGGVRPTSAAKEELASMFADVGIHAESPHGTEPAATAPLEATIGGVLAGAGHSAVLCGGSDAVTSLPPPVAASCEFATAVPPPLAFEPSGAAYKAAAAAPFFSVESSGPSVAVGAATPLGSGGLCAPPPMFATVPPSTRFPTSQGAAPTQLPPSWACWQAGQPLSTGGVSGIGGVSSIGGAGGMGGSSVGVVGGMGMVGASPSTGGIGHTSGAFGVGYGAGAPMQAAGLGGFGTQLHPTATPGAYAPADPFASLMTANNMATAQPQGFSTAPAGANGDDGAQKDPFKDRFTIS